MYTVCDPGLHRQKVNLTKQVLCFSAGLSLVFCSHSVNRCLYSWTCSALPLMCYMSLWIINEPKLIRRQKQ